MSNLSMADLLERKNQLLRDIKNIEESYEGVINPANNEKIYKLNKERELLLEDRKKIADNLTNIDVNLGKINNKIRKLSSDNVDKILNGINEQRWFFFKNKPKVVFDKFTGILWANLDYFKFYNEHSEGHTYTYEQAVAIIDDLQLDGFSNWSIPTTSQFLYMIDDKTFPFQEGEGHRIRDLDYWFATEGENYCIDLDDFNRGKANVYLLPCNTILTSEEYERNILSDNKVFSHNERMQFTLDIFINNKLEPIFNNPRISDLYYKIYIEKPDLQREYDSIVEKIGKNQENILAASSIDYDLLIKDYNLEEINSSIVKYYKAVQKWIDKLLDTVNFFEEENIITTTKIEDIGDIIVKDYNYELEMDDSENILFEKRRTFLKKHTAVSSGNIKSTLLGIKKNADEIEREIMEINREDNLIESLGKLEKRDRASFELIAESTVGFVQDLLGKAENYENNKRSLKTIINIDSSWADDYRILKVKLKSKYKNICENAGVDPYSWNLWYKDWCDRRLLVEEMFLPLIEREIQYGIKEADDGIVQIVTPIEKILNALQLYKDNIDDFYTNERKDIHLKYKKKGGMDKELAAEEDKLKKIGVFLKGNIENVVSKLEKNEDKIFIQKWIKPLVGIDI